MATRLTIHEQGQPGNWNGWAYHLRGGGVYSYAIAQLVEKHWVLSAKDPITFNYSIFGVKELADVEGADKGLVEQMQKQVQSITSSWATRNNPSDLEFNDQTGKIILPVVAASAP